MKRLVIALISLSIALAALADDGPKDGVLMIIRHAEKPASGPLLTVRGEQRALAYVRYFRKLTVDSKPLLPDAIFAAADSEESKRPRLTVEPLAKAIGLQIDTRFNDKRIRELTGELRASQQGRRVLICWRHGGMPDLLRALGADPEKILPDGKWPSQVFDWVIQLSYDHEGRLMPAGARRLSGPAMPDDSR